MLPSAALPATVRAEAIEVSAGYGGGDVVSRVSARFEAASVTVIAGPNGCGKSTLLAVLAGLHPISSGRLLRSGSGRVAFVPQSSALPQRLPLTVRDLVRMGRWADRGSWRPLRRADAEIADESMAALDLLPLAGRVLSSLSGGQRQRALVAQGLAQRAEMLLLDEPTAWVDDASRGLVATALLGEARRGTAVVQASHDPAAIAAADLVLRLG